MSDSFADLWSSSAAIPPKTKPQTLASASSYSFHGSTTKGTSKPDAFSLLANPIQQLRYGSPSSISGKRSATSTPPIPPLSVTPSRGAATAGLDAFSDLFSSTASSVTGPSNGSVKSQTGLTIAERLAMEAQAKSSRTVGEEPRLGTDVGSQDSAWAGLDSLVRSGTALHSSDRSRGTINSNGGGDDWGLGDLSSFSSSTASAAASSTARSAPEQPRPQKSSLKPTTLWDLQDFASPSSSAQPSRPSSQPKAQQQSQLNRTQKSDSSGFDFDITSQDDVDGPRQESRGGSGLLDLDSTDLDFGLGEQKEGLLDQDFDFSGRIGNRGISDDDDILGILSQPVEAVKVTKKPSPSPIASRPSSLDDHLPSSSRRSRIQSTSSSPPPHVLGQIVEMGFSVELAKKALANTKDGRDIQAALETLLGSSGGTETRREGLINERVVEEGQEPQPPVRRGAPKGFKERERERVERMRREREQETSIPSGESDVVSDMQEHADRLLSQASEIGLSVLTKASAFWKEKKERVVKVYEERAATTITGQKERADGGPKWMMEDVVSGFRDADDGDDHLKAKEKRIPRTTQEPEQRRQNKFTELKSEVDLFRAGPSELAGIHQQRRTPNREISTPSSQVAVAEAATPPFPLPTRDRPLPTASPSNLSSVDKHRTAGSSQFKLGQYASAIESYSAAISSLLPGHLLLLPLLNNRALARMRTGEYKAAAADAAQALGVVLVTGDCVDGFDPNAKETAIEVTITSWHPSMEPSFLLTAAQQKANNGGWAHPQGFGVDLVDGYVKALRRRAEASEGRERWSDALKFWEVLSAGDSAWIKEHLRKEAQRSAARCRKMITNETSASIMGEEALKLKLSPPVTKRRPTPVPPTAPSAVLRSLQETNAQAEAEDNLKHQLKDSVDSKLAAWRTGKETNIRALLASLDMVLWEEVLRGVKVGGLHELVTPAQVKKGYIKAIARVHPDKLNPQNSTVEQRMLANAVFGTLSEAWTSFQSSNGM